jgi:CSLREA domain-containing protein
MPAHTRHRNLLRVGACAIVGLIGALPLARALPVEAASVISVTTTADENTANGACSLREAVIAANTDSAADSCPSGSGADTIVLPAGTYVLSIPGSFEDAALTGDLDLTGDVTITGAGSIIDANGIDRVIDVLGDATVVLTGLTVRGGAADPNDDNGGGGINNKGVLTLLDSSVSGNAAVSSVGGGISSSGTMTVRRSTISSNVANSGGGVYIRGTTLLFETTVSANSVVTSAGAGTGGGISNHGDLRLTNSTISGNTVSIGAGDSFGLGGGIFNSGSDLPHLVLNSSTISNNNITVQCSLDPEDVDFDLCPLAQGAGVGDIQEGGGTATSNTIIFGNTRTFVASPELGGAPRTEEDNCDDPVVSLGYNFVGVGCVPEPPTNLLLGPLQGNGGPTMTHDLGVGSPAIDAGNPAPAGSSATACPRTDQRGMPRPDDGNADGSSRCDIGAVETTAIDSTSYTVRYDGWAGVIDAAASGGGYRAASAAGQTVSLTKTRANATSSVSIITYKGPDQGKVAVTIDGASAVTKDLYAATPAFRTVITFSVASANKHSISIKVLGTRNAASTGTEFRFDGAKFAGTVFDDTNTSARYGGWSTAVDANAAGGSYRSASVVATASFDTVGPVFTLITARGPAYGMVRVTIDGVTRANLDLYRPDQKWLARQTFTNLGSGVHHVVIKVLGTKNASASGTAVVFDAITFH